MTSKGLRKFFRRRYRDVFATSITGTTAAQIRATREKRGWSQHELAEKAGMAQARISLLENPNYESPSLSTLKRVANALDVALVVRFTSFGKFFALVDSEEPGTLALPSFEEEFGTEADPIVTPREKVIDLTRMLGRDVHKGDPKDLSGLLSLSQQGAGSSPPQPKQGSLSIPALPQGSQPNPLSNAR
jgi:transcriptional regulator with XRE-family HTH domain